jgi:hypothetical protein
MPKRPKKKDLEQQRLLNEMQSLKPKLKEVNEILAKTEGLSGDLLVEEIVLIDDMNSLS